MSMSTLEFAKQIRINALEMTHLGRSSHIGSVLSLVDILAVLYNHPILRYQANNPKWGQRDRLILSKGHAGAGLYAALALSGFFSLDILKTHYQDGSILSGHVSHKNIPGVEFSTGSLGHGLPVSVGMAYAASLQQQSHLIFTILSDGECDEGSNWEAIMSAGHFKLNNLIVIIDYNNLQSIDTIANTMNLEPFAKKWTNFGWQVHEIDGHNHQEISKVLLDCPHNNQPSCIIAHTTKGKGISFMENQVLWHYRSAQGKEFEQALKELQG